MNENKEKMNERNSIAGEVDVSEERKVTIRKKLIYKISPARNKDEEKELIPIDENCEVIQIIDCETLNNTSDVLSSLDVRKCRNAFIFLLETKIKGNDENVRNILNTISLMFQNEHPLIAAIKSEHCDEFKYFFKNSNYKEFSTIKPKCQLNSSSFDVEMLLSLLADLRTSLVDVNLQDVAVRLSNKSIMDLFASAIIANDLVMLRMLKLFDCQFSNAELLQLFEVGIKYGQYEAFIALINLPISNEIEDATPDITRILALENDTKDNIVSIAIDCKSIQVLKFLLNFNFSQWKFAMSYALDRESFDIFNELRKIEPCDKKDKMEQLKLLCEFDSNLKDISELHENISEENLDEIKDFISKYPNFKLCYGTEKVCALEKAIDCRKAEIYSLLLANGFYTDKQNELEKKIRKLPRNVREKIRHENVSRSIADEENFINILVQRCHFSSTTRHGSFEDVRGMFRKLSEISDIKILLQTLSQLDVKIILECTSKSISTVDPSIIGSGTTTGIAYNKGGVIIVGEYQDEDAKCGTFTHECTHFVLYAIYTNNYCLPYCEGDTSRENGWRAVVDELRESVRSDPDKHDLIIRWVFENYQDRKEQEGEMAVRVNHMLALYRNNSNRLRQLELQYYKLFEFYRTNIQPDFIIPNGIELRKLNNSIGLFRQIQSYSSVRLESTKTQSKSYKILDEINGDGKTMVVVVTNLPLLALQLISREIFDADENKLHLKTKNIFIELEKLEHANVREQLNRVKNSPTILRFITQTKYLNRPEYMDFYNAMGEFKDKIKYIFVTSNQPRQDKYFPQLDAFKILSVRFNWLDLDFTTRLHALFRMIEFQNNRISLNQIFSVDSHEISHEIVSNIFDHDEKISINMNDECDNSNSDDFYIPRKFHKKIKVEYYEKDHLMEEKFPRSIQELQQRDVHTHVGKDSTREKLKVKFEFEMISLEDLLQTTSKDKIILISDLSGTGKTSTLKFIRKKLKFQAPACWFSFVNLKEHLDTFKTIQIDTFSAYMCDHILRLKSPLEKAAFKALYDAHRVILMLDGFDEISPDCKDVVMVLIGKFKEQPSLQLWITTRTHLEHDLEQKFDLLAYSITPLTEAEQVDFLVSYWSRNAAGTHIDVSKSSEMKNFATRLIREMSEMIDNKVSNLIGLPLQIQMIGDVYRNIVNKNQIVENLDTQLQFYHIYSNFLRAKSEIWMKNKGKLAKSSYHNAQYSLTNFIQIHQYFALKYYFGYLEDVFSLDYDEIEWPNEEIVRCGIIRFDENNFYFLHDTFAEFLLADFIVKIFNRIKKSWIYLEDFSSMFMKVLSEEKFQIVRMFLNDKIEAITKCDFAREVIFRDEVLTQSAKEGNFNLCLFLLKSISIFDEKLFTNLISNHDTNPLVLGLLNLNNQKELKYERIFDFVFQTHHEDLLEGRHANGNTYLHCLAIYSRCPRLFSNILQKIHNKLDRDEFMKILFKTNNHNITFFHSLFLYNKSAEMKVIMIDLIKKILTTDEHRSLCKLQDNKGSTLFHYSYVNSPNEIDLIFDYITTVIVVKSEQIEMIFQSNETKSNMLHLSSHFASDEIHKYLLNKILQIIVKPQQQEELLLVEEENGMNALASTLSNDVKIFSFMFNFYKEKFTIDKFKKIIMERSSQGLTLFHYAIYFASIDVIKFLWNEILCIFDAVEIESVIKSTPKSTPSLLPQIIKANDVEIFNFIWKIHLNYFTLTEMIEIIYQNELFHNTARFSSTEMIEAFLMKIKQLLTCSSDQKKYFMSHGKSSCPAFALATHNNHPNSFAYVFDFYESICDTSELKQQIFTNYSDGKNFIYHTHCCGSLEAIQVFWHKINQFYDNDELKIILKLNYGQHKSLLMLTFLNNKNEKATEFMWNILATYFNRDELMEMIYEDHKGSRYHGNIFFYIAYLKSKEIITALWNKFQNILIDPDIQKDYLMQRVRDDFKTADALQASIFNKNDEYFTAMFEIYRNIFEDDLKSIIWVRNYGENFPLFHPVFMYGNLTQIKFLWCEMKQLFTSTELNEILKSIHYLGRNSLCNAIADMFNKSIVSFIWEIYEECLDKSEMLHIINARDILNNNLLHIAAQSTSKEILQLSWNKIVAIIDNESNEKNYLQTRGNGNRTALEVSAQNGINDIFLTCWTIYDEYFNLSMQILIFSSLCKMFLRQKYSR